MSGETWTVPRDDAPGTMTIVPEVVVGRARMRDPEWLPEPVVAALPTRQGDSDNLEPVIPAILERFNAFVERLAAQARDFTTGAYVQCQEDYTLWPPAIEVPVMGPNDRVTLPPWRRVVVSKIRDTTYRPWCWNCTDCPEGGRYQSWRRAFAVADLHAREGHQ